MKRPAEGAQDHLAEQRPTSLIEPGSLGTSEFEAETPETCEPAPNKTPPCDCNLDLGQPGACTAANRRSSAAVTRTGNI